MTGVSLGKIFKTVHNGYAFVVSLSRNVISV